jgi:hypothetical protein
MPKGGGEVARVAKGVEGVKGVELPRSWVEHHLHCSPFAKRQRAPPPGMDRWRRSVPWREGPTGDAGKCSVTRTVRASAGYGIRGTGCGRSTVAGWATEALAALLYRSCQVGTPATCRPVPGESRRAHCLADRRQRGQAQRRPRADRSRLDRDRGAQSGAARRPHRLADHAHRRQSLPAPSYPHRRYRPQLLRGASATGDS